MRSITIRFVGLLDLGPPVGRNNIYICKNKYNYNIHYSFWIRFMRAVLTSVIPLSRVKMLTNSG